jgi:hypothetical protein
MLDVDFGPFLRAFSVAQAFSAPCKGVELQWVRFPPGNWSFQPVAIGTAVEVTKLSKLLVKRVA